MTQSLKIHDRIRIAIKPDGTKVPVRDSKFTFLLTPNTEDIQKGVPGDHANCMYCRAARRMYGSDLVWVTRSLAYIELKNKYGRSELHRFILSDPAKLKVKDFDASQHVDPHAVIFAAPRGSNTLAAQHKAYKKRVATKDNSKKRSPVTGKKQDHTIRPLSGALRNPATGMFQFKQA